MKKISLSFACLTIALSAASAQEAAKETETTDASATKVSWEKDVWPFIENSCVKCHKAPYTDEATGREKKPKADLRYDGKAFILKGGENNDETPALTPGDPEKSSMLTLAKLPLDHDDHMPPEGKADPLTEEQLKTLELWIKEGADFGDWVGATE